MARPAPAGRRTPQAVISRGRWWGTTFPLRLNAGLAAIRAWGDCDAITTRHLTRLPDGQGG